jgi:glycosyltransferase involved in cell wall biosynthesis
MAGRDIVIANKGLAFSGHDLGARPLGGVESATIALAEALARQGHRVRVFNDTPRKETINGVQWQPIGAGMPWTTDLYIANRQHELLAAIPFAKKRALWLHNPASDNATWTFRPRLALFPATVVVLGEYHRTTCPPWLPQKHIKIIPLGLSQPFLTDRSLPTPRPRHAIFTSNAGRNLDWLLTVWAQRIAPFVPDAQLHIYSGPQVYRMQAGTGYNQMMATLARADALAAHGVVRHEPLGRDALAERVAAARLMLYRGHPDETFCLALAEAQALGVPCVVQPIGSVAERVRDGITGFVAADEDSFAQRAIDLLTDDGLAETMSRAAARLQRSRSWDDVARDFAALMAP